MDKVERLTKVLENCIPILEDAAQGYNNLVEFKLLPSSEYDNYAKTIQTRLEDAIRYIKMTLK